MSRRSREWFKKKTVKGRRVKHSWHNAVGVHNPPEHLGLFFLVSLDGVNIGVAIKRTADIKMEEIVAAGRHHLMGHHVKNTQPDQKCSDDVELGRVSGLLINLHETPASHVISVGP